LLACLELLGAKALTSNDPKCDGERHVFDLRQRYLPQVIGLLLDRIIEMKMEWEEVLASEDEAGTIDGCGDGEDEGEDIWA